MLTDLSDVLAELQEQALLSKNAQMQSVTNVTINACYKVTDEGEEYFLKLFSHHEQLPVDRLAIFKLQVSLADKGMAPMPLYLSASQDFQLESYSPSDFHNSDTDIDIGALASCQASIHAMDVVVAPLRLDEKWARYISLLPDEDREHWQMQADALKVSLALMQCASDVLCHHDLSWSHIGKTNPALIYDWEYAARGNRFFDLANTIEVNQLSDEQVSVFFDSYSACTGIPIAHIRHQVKEIMPLVKFTASLWFKSVENSVG